MEGITSYARTRFISALCFSIAGSTLGIGAFVFTPRAEHWLGVGVGAGSSALLLCVFAASGRGTVQRILDAVLAPICAWAIVSALTIETAASGPNAHLVRWLGFSAGAAIAALGFISLVAHEFSLEHDLQYATERIWGLTPHSQEDTPMDRYSQSIER